MNLVPWVVLRALELFQEVVHIPDARRCGIGKPVSCDNLEHVLLLRETSVGVLPCGSRGRLGAEGSERAFLDARVHVRFVVIADVENVVVAIDRARKRLEADICRAAVARKADDRTIVGLLPLCPQTGLDAREHGRRGRKRRDHRVVRKAQLGEVEADGAHATRGQCRHRVRTEHLQCRADRKRAAAASACLVPEKQLVSRHVLRIHRHYRAPSLQSSPHAGRLAAGKSIPRKLTRPSPAPWPVEASSRLRRRQHHRALARPHYRAARRT